VVVSQNAAGVTVLWSAEVLDEVLEGLIGDGQG
jgi:hypothetical protein